MERLMDLLTGVSLVLIAAILVSVRRAHIRVEYSVSWLAAAVTLLILSRCEGFLMSLARWLGVGEPPVVILLLGAGIFLIVFFRFSLIISELKDANVALTQRVAILEYKLETLCEQQTGQGQKQAGDVRY